MMLPGPVLGRGDGVGSITGILSWAGKAENHQPRRGWGTRWGSASQGPCTSPLIGVLWKASLLGDWGPLLHLYFLTRFFPFDP